MFPPSGPSRSNWRTPATPRQQHRGAQACSNPPRGNFHQSRISQTPARDIDDNIPARLQLNNLRKQLCPFSSIWTPNFDLRSHRADWRAGNQRYRQYLLDRTKTLARTRQNILTRYGPDWLTPRPTPPRVPFDGRTFVGRNGSTTTTNLGPVLPLTTVFVPTWDQREDPPASWPCDHELRYEGDNRPKTDGLHRRFFPLPRVAEASVNWQQRASIGSCELDEVYFYLPAIPRHPRERRPEREVDWEEVWFSTMSIPYREFREEDEGGWNGEESWRRSLGTDLLGLLDPMDQWV